MRYQIPAQHQPDSMGYSQKHDPLHFNTSALFLPKAVQLTLIARSHQTQDGNLLNEWYQGKVFKNLQRLPSRKRLRAKAKVGGEHSK